MWFSGFWYFKIMMPRRSKLWQISHYFDPLPVKIMWGVVEIYKSKLGNFRFSTCCFVSIPKRVTCDWCRKSSRNFALYVPLKIKEGVGKMYVWTFQVPPCLMVKIRKTKNRGKTYNQATIESTLTIMRIVYVNILSIDCCHAYFNFIAHIKKCTNCSRY